MAADVSATTMLHIIDNLLPASALQDLRDLCDIHGRLKEEHDGDAQFSWRPETGSPRSIHAAAQQAVVDHYLDEALLPLATPFAPQQAGSSGGATPTTISTGTSTRTSWKVDAAAVSCCRCYPPCFTPT